MKPRDEKKTEQIFLSTLKLVQEKGIAGITMGEIAKEASLATGTLYIYFKSKDELINALYTSLREASAEVYFNNYDNSQPFKTGFRTIWFNILKHRIEKFEEFVFLDQCYHSPFITESTKEMTKKIFSPLYSLIERGKQENLIRNSETRLLLTFMIGAINEIVKHAHYSNKKLSKTNIEQMFEMCWEGLKA